MFKFNIRIITISFQFLLSCIAFECIADDADSYNPVSNRYLVTVSKNGEKVDSCIVYQTKTLLGSQREWSNQINKSFHFLNVTNSGDLEIDFSVTKIGSKAKSAVLRPGRLGLGIKRADIIKDNSMIRFAFKGTGKISVEFEDDSNNSEPLLIFINPKETTSLIPDTSNRLVYSFKSKEALTNISSDKTIIYFKSGVHKVGYWDVPGFIKQIYLDDNAILIGYLSINRKNSNIPIVINGNGVISNYGFPYHYPSSQKIDNYEHNSNWYKPISIIGGENHLIKGITIIDPTAYAISVNAINSKILNVKVNGFRLNNDAVTLTGKNITIDNCFFRVNDDAVVFGFVSDVFIRNTVFWQLGGSIFQLGWTPHTLTNIRIEKIDVLHAEWTDKSFNSGFINSMAIERNSQKSMINGLTVANVYFDTPVSSFIDITPQRANAGKNMNKSATWIYQNIKFSKIYLKGGGTSQKPLINFSGYSQQNQSKNIIFEKFYIDGKPLTKENFLDKKFSILKNITGLSIDNSN